MIVQNYDWGWGPEFETKKFEVQILRDYLGPFHQDDSKTVIVNNTWYSDRAHAKTVEGLLQNRPDRIVLVSMIDAANCRAEQFAEFADDIRCVGYYAGADEIDFWALAVDRWFQVPDDDLLDCTDMDTAYLCLNRKPHHHRQQLFDALVATGVVDQGLVSMGARGDGSTPQRSLPQDIGLSNLNLNPNPGIEQTGIVNDIMSLGHADNWRRIFLDVVTETQFNLRKTQFVSEKIYKPIVGMRPFLVYAKDGAVSWLSKRGFEPYVNDFRDITDLDLSSYHNIVPFLQVLCQQPRNYYQKRFIDLQEKIKYNRQQFDRYVQQIKNKVQEGIQCQI